MNTMFIQVNTNSFLSTQNSNITTNNGNVGKDISKGGKDGEVTQFCGYLSGSGSVGVVTITCKVPKVFCMMFASTR